jgi:surface carbohydrate biosynthesis protein
MKKTIYIPLEIKARELASQTLLAGQIAKMGGRVYLGSKSAIFLALNLKSACNGTLLYKGGMGNEKGFKLIRQHVSKVAVLDQEMSPKTITDPGSRFVGRELDYVDRLYYVGQQLADEILRGSPDLSHSKVKALGWPRVDLWTKRYESLWQPSAKRVRDRYGDFVLFSSDFGVLDSATLAWRIEQMKALWVMEPGREVRDKARVERLGDTLAEFPRVLEFLRRLDQEPNFPPVIVRPHPSENHSVWERALRGSKKTHLVYEGDISTYLHASVALLHRGCTTALQAEVLGKPTGAIVTDRGTCGNSGKFSEYSAQISTIEEAVKLVDPAFQVPAPNIDPYRISSLDGTASEKIAEDLLDLTGEPERLLPTFWTIGMRRAFWVRVAQIGSRRFRSGMKRRIRHTSHSISVNKMQGGIQVSEVRDILDNIGMCDVDVSKVVNNLVCIEMR